MEELPAELIISIGQLVEKYTLCSLVRCCQRLYDILQPLFYSELRLTPPLTASYTSLVIRLWQRPDLASLVRHAEIHFPISVIHPSYLFDHDKGSEVEDFVDGVLNAMWDLKERRPRDMLKEGLRNGRWGSWMGVLFTRLTHLQTIEFVGFYNNQTISDMINRAGNRQRPFDAALPYPHLRQISIRECERGFNLEALTPFFYFPAVETVDVAQMWEGRGRDNSSEGRRKPGHASCPVKRIIVRSLKQSRGTLTWLADCTGLEHISVRIACTFVGLPETRFGVPFNPARFLQALLPFTRTLKSLHVEYDELYNSLLNSDGSLDLFYEDIFWLTEDEQKLDHCNAPVGSLRGFEVLEAISLRHANLLPPVSDDRTKSQGILVDRLPKSLRTLRVFDIVQSLCADLLWELSVLVTTHDAFPHLKEIYLQGKAIDEVALRSLQFHCEATGISLTY
ncbi:uncharacterized protein BO97DRAFT_47056 [Aspergillus homomorphus CBS 101889]|uniref:F-box domain-containing protein n=1 Tax=Aspergillus homomorphus (strain CBS 101889) TaxID=1450537 RepID=A0A395I2Q8_ASPHC|nr:hypothetical protein BO97DRAFT_47056 [Aspergillus homomorphus CBS 101889]RAL12854.1 hypothetical protein BO97DRAFT_47056 [Aspergillus homomorphus CBS 101889]